MVQGTHAHRAVAAGVVVAPQAREQGVNVGSRAREGLGGAEDGYTGRNATCMERHVKSDGMRNVQWWVVGGSNEGGRDSGPSVLGPSVAVDRLTIGSPVPRDVVW